MLYVKLKNSCKIGKKAMLEWGIKGEVLTLDAPLLKQWSSSFSKLKTSQKLQEQPLSTSVVKRRCDFGCLCTKVRQNTHRTQKRGRYRYRIDTQLKP